MMLESVKDYSIFCPDAAGIITLWNSGAERLFGYAEAEILDRHCRILFTPEDCELGVPERELNTAGKTGCATDDRWHMRKDGSRFYANGIVHPIRDEAGSLQGFTKIAHDVTAKKLEDEKSRSTAGQHEALIAIQRTVIEAGGDIQKVKEAEYGIRVSASRKSSWRPFSTYSFRRIPPSTVNTAAPVSASLSPRRSPRSWAAPSRWTAKRVKARRLRCASNCP